MGQRLVHAGDGQGGVVEEELTELDLRLGDRVGGVGGDVRQRDRLGEAGSPSCPVVDGGCERLAELESLLVGGVDGRVDTARAPHDEDGEQREHEPAGRPRGGRHEK